LLLSNFGKDWLIAFGEREVTPYIHVMVCHTTSILLAHGSLSLFSQEGFEHCHKWQKQIYYFATSHDGKVSSKRIAVNSIEQILNHVYRIHLITWYTTKEEWEKFNSNSTSIT